MGWAFEQPFDAGTKGAPGPDDADQAKAENRPSDCVPGDLKQGEGIVPGFRAKVMGDLVVDGFFPGGAKTGVGQPE
jgi:hypothetical protein